MYQIVSKKALNPTVTQMDIAAPYVAKKARYLVKDEDGVGAELRLQKPIKGRIYKSLEKEGAFNFVPNPDKEGNPVEVDLSIIFFGSSVKVLSK